MAYEKTHLNQILKIDVVKVAKKRYPVDNTVGGVKTQLKIL